MSTATKYYNGTTDIGTYFCDLTNDQTVKGTKTFETTPVIGTKASDNNTTSAASTSSTSTKKGGRTKGAVQQRTRMSEETEDKQLMKIATSAKGMVRLTCQPHSIKGGVMRPYQIDGLNWLVMCFVFYT